MYVLYMHETYSFLSILMPLPPKNPDPSKARLFLKDPYTGLLEGPMISQFSGIDFRKKKIFRRFWPSMDVSSYRWPFKRKKAWQAPHVDVLRCLYSVVWRLLHFLNSR